MLNNILKSNKKWLYLYNKNNQIHFPIIKINIENSYNAGNSDGALQEMENNLKKIIKEFEEGLKIVIEKKNKLRQNNLF